MLHTSFHDSPTNPHQKVHPEVTSTSHNEITKFSPQIDSHLQQNISHISFAKNSPLHKGKRKGVQKQRFRPSLSKRQNKSTQFRINQILKQELGVLNVQVEIDSLKVDFQLDPGAVVSLVNKDTLNEIKSCQPKYAQKLTNYQPLQITDYNNKKISSGMPHALQFSLGDEGHSKMVTWPFYVTKTGDNIFGLDLLIFLRANLIWKEDNMMLVGKGFSIKNTLQKLHAGKIIDVNINVIQSEELDANENLSEDELDMDQVVIDKLGNLSDPPPPDWAQNILDLDHLQLHMKMQIVNFFKEDFPNLVPIDNFDPGCLDPNIYLITDYGCQGEPVRSKTIPLHGEQHERLKKIIDIFMERGIMKRAISPYASPVFLVSKASIPSQPRRDRLVANYKKNESNFSTISLSKSGYFKYFHKNRESKTGSIFDPRSDLSLYIHSSEGWIKGHAAIKCEH